MRDHIQESEVIAPFVRKYVRMQAQLIASTTQRHLRKFHQRRVELVVGNLTVSLLSGKT